MNIKRRHLLLLLTLSLAPLVIAQDDDNFFADNDAEAPATLSLNFNRQGAVQATLTLPENAAESDELPGVLAQSLHCPLYALTHPDDSQYASRDFEKKWSAARRERFHKQMADSTRRFLSGHCEGALSKQGQLFAGNLNFTALTRELQRLGVDRLLIYIEIPKTQFREYTQTNLVRDVLIQSGTLLYRIPITEKSSLPVLHLAYGFRPADLHRAFAILGAFVVVPVLLTFWMRRRALALATMDAAAAWFGFLRTLNWLVLGVSLLWLTSGFGARQMLQDWVASLGFSTFKAALLDVSVFIIPAFLPYFLCLSLSYPVHAQLRGTQWTHREFLLRQSTLVGTWALPLMIVLAALGLINEQPELAIALFFLSFLVLRALQFLRFRITKELPQPLTTGELRDRVFGLAGQLGVAVRQIFILPAGKGQIANAYAAQNRIVMFTDYLLEHLDKHEVDGVAAHELAHLRHNHPGKRMLVFLAVMFLPFYFGWLMRSVTGLIMEPLGALTATTVTAKVVSTWWKALFFFEQWSQKDFFLLVFGMTGFYFYSRHCENVADAAAVRLTGNAEAQITGLLKVSRLNLIPIRWGKASEKWLTHPSTVRRAHRMAAVGGLAPERLQQILQEYDSQDNRAKIAPPEDRYCVPSADDPEKVNVALRDRTRTQARLWLNLALYVLPIAAFSVLIQKIGLNGYGVFASYLAAIAITSVIVTLGSVCIGESGKEHEKIRLERYFERQGISLGRAGDVVVGFAPGPYPRIFGSRYHWDSGFLIFAKNQLQFIGQQVKFSFSPSDINAVTVARGGPSWWKFERVYVRWKTDDGRNGVFNLNSLEPGSVWRTNRRVRDLCSQIEQWRRQPENYDDVRSQLKNLKPLDVGQVTSDSPKKSGSLRITLTVLWMLLLLTFAVGTLIRAEMGYLISSIMALRLIQSIPYWRYQDRIPTFDSEAVGKARAAAQS